MALEHRAEWCHCLDGIGGYATSQPRNQARTIGQVPISPVIISGICDDVRISHIPRTPFLRDLKINHRRSAFRRAKLSLTFGAIRLPPKEPGAATRRHCNEYFEEIRRSADGDVFRVR